MIDNERMWTMDEQRFLLESFEEHRDHLRRVAYRMLGSASEADDALQESWLRVSRADTSGVDNIGGWLTTVTARVCLNMLRSRGAKREDLLAEEQPDSASSSDPTTAPEDEAVLADSVGLAMLVVLETLSPAERLAFVLHDMFAVPFDEIGTIVGKTPTAARQLASRARSRVQGKPKVPTADLARHRDVVNAFLAAARDGDFDALVAVLDPDVVARVDTPDGTTRVVHGASTFASQAILFGARAAASEPALVNGAAGFVVAPGGRLTVAFAFTIADGKITEIDIVTHPERLDGLDVAVLDA